MKKKAKTNSPILTVVVMLILSAMVLSGFFFLRERAKKGSERAPKNEVGKLLELDLENNYPGNAREVLKIHNRIMKCYYNEKLSEEELKGLAEQNRKLFDKKLIEENPFDDYAKALMAEIADFKEKKISIVSEKIQEFADAEREVRGGFNFCNLLVSYFVKEDKGHKTTNEKFYLREDENGRWKILFWELTDATF